MYKFLAISIFVLSTVCFAQDYDKSPAAVDSNNQKEYSESRPFELRVSKKFSKSKKNRSKKSKKKKLSKLVRKNKSWLSAEIVDKKNENQVAIPVTVYGAGSKQITDIKKDEIKVFENGVEQKIQYFGKLSESKTIILLPDVSWQSKIQT